MARVRSQATTPRSAAADPLDTVAPLSLRLAIMSIPRSRPPHRPRSGACALVLALVLGAAFGCSPETGVPSIDRSTYVDVMVALRVADNETSSETEFLQRREQILQEAGVTDSMLVQWVRAHGGDIRFMAELWDSINARLNAGEQEGTAR